MNLPFTSEQFFSVFEQYNRAVWPTQIFLTLLALAAVVLAIVRRGSAGKIISGILAFLWSWVGIAYHYTYFTSINPAAYFFALLNVVQGIVFLVVGVIGARIFFNYRTDLYGVTGTIFITYALILYPALGFALGHVYPKAPTFGLPCPTTIFTFGVLLWTSRKIPKVVLVIPFLWSLIGSSAALALGMREDFGLLAAGVIGTLLIILRDRNKGNSVPDRLLDSDR